MIVINTIRDLPLSTYHIDKIAFYTGENAQEALNYLLTEINYKPDEDSCKDVEGRTCPKDLLYYLEYGFPKKPRYQLRDGDYTMNEIGLCCGHYQEGNKWIAFDNTTNDCWVEEFPTEEECLKYLKREDK